MLKKRTHVTEHFKDDFDNESLWLHQVCNTIYNHVDCKFKQGNDNVAHCIFNDTEQLTIDIDNGTIAYKSLVTGQSSNWKASAFKAFSTDRYNFIMFHSLSDKVLRVNV